MRSAQKLFALSSKFRYQTSHFFRYFRPFWFLFGVFGALFLGWCFSSAPASISVAPKNGSECTSRGGWIYLFVAILSSHDNESLRNAARRTWLKFENRSVLDVSHRFFVGMVGIPVDRRAALEREASLNRDLVLLHDVPDENRTYKLLRTLAWISHKCEARYVLKLDDDSFARPDAIAWELSVAERNVAHEPRLYWGFFAGDSPVVTSGERAEPSWYLSERYLPYACSGGYILSAAVMRYIYDHRSLLERYANEDVSMGVWLAALKMNRTHDRRFDTEHRSRGCFNSYLVTGKQTEAMMEEKHRSLERNGILCPQEVQLRPSYIYDWGVRPSRCCIRNASDISLPRSQELGKGNEMLVGR